MARIPLKSLTFPDNPNKYVIPEITSLAPAYREILYALGTLVTYDNNLYRANTDINVAETWTPSHWDLVAMSTVTGGLNAEVTRIGNQLDAIRDDISSLENIDQIFSFEIDSDGHLIETVERYSSTNIEFKLEDGRLIVTYG